MLLDGAGPFEEAFYTLRTNLQYIAVGHPLRRILVTSSVPDEGKTTVCANLALAFAQSGASVAVLETDLRRPHLSSIFDLSPFANGLTSVLVGRARLQDAIRHVRPFGVLDRTESDRDVALLSSGPVPPNPSELVGSTEMRKVVDQLSEQFDSIILDSPPILLVADAVELAKLADGVIVVVRANQITRDTAREVRALANRLDIQLVGAVVTGVPPRVGYSYPHSYEAPGEGTRDAARVRTSPEPVSLATRTLARRRKPGPAPDRAAGAPSSSAPSVIRATGGPCDAGILRPLLPRDVGDVGQPSLRAAASRRAPGQALARARLPARLRGGGRRRERQAAPCHLRRRVPEHSRRHSAARAARQSSTVFACSALADRGAAGLTFPSSPPSSRRAPTSWSPWGGTSSATFRPWSRDRRAHRDAPASDAALLGRAGRRAPRLAGAYRGGARSPVSHLCLSLWRERRAGPGSRPRGRLRGCLRPAGVDRLAGPVRPSSPSGSGGPTEGSSSR